MKLVTAITRFIDQTLLQERRLPTVNEIAERAGWSRYRLTRHFQDVFGMSLGEFARERQTKLARRLLERTNLPVKEVSFKCGFSRASAFSRAFRNTTGLAPMRYRARKRSKRRPAQNGK
jgi:AraC family transcriptional regulator